MGKEFIVDFSLEQPVGANATFSLVNNNVNATFNISEPNTLNATFDIIRAGGGDKYYMFEQATSSAVWQITHNLNKKPSVTVVDEYDRVVIPAVRYIDDNKVELTFNFSFKGRAYLN